MVTRQDSRTLYLCTTLYETMMAIIKMAIVHHQAGQQDTPHAVQYWLLGPLKQTNLLAPH